jgi:hypothetical protein
LSIINAPPVWWGRMLRRTKKKGGKVDYLDMLKYVETQQAGIY